MDFITVERDVLREIAALYKVESEVEVRGVLKGEVEIDHADVVQIHQAGSLHVDLVLFLFLEQIFS